MNKSEIVNKGYEGACAMQTDYHFLSERGSHRLKAPLSSDDSWISHRSRLDEILEVGLRYFEECSLRR